MFSWWQSHRRTILVVFVAALACCGPKKKKSDDESGSNPPGPGPAKAHVAAVRPYDAATPTVSELTILSKRLRTAIGEAHPKLTTANRTSLMTAWVAVDTAATLAAYWRDRLVEAPNAKTAEAMSQLRDHAAKLFASLDASSARAGSVAVYNDARALALTLVAARSKGGDSALPAVDEATCKTIANNIHADLGGIATSELLLGSTRAGYPWVALSPQEAAERLDARRFPHPVWKKPVTGAPDPVAIRKKLSDRFTSMPTHGQPALDAFDSAVKGGFSASSAARIAEASPSDKSINLLTAGIAAQVTTATTAPAGAPDEFATIGALVGGINNGARARSAAIGEGKPFGVVKDLGASHNEADKQLATVRKQLIACALLPMADDAKLQVLVGLLSVQAYGTLGETCSTTNECGPGLTCSSGTCVPWCGGCTAAGDTCVDAKCALPDHACQGNSDCPSSEVCNANVCVQACIGAASGTCGFEQKCTCSGANVAVINGQCTRVAQSCSTPADCTNTPGDLCSGGVCQAPCGGVGSSCPNTQVCVANACQPRNGTCSARGACTVCTAGQFCDDGSATPGCKNGPAERACATDADCTPPPEVPSQAIPRCVAVVADAAGAPAVKMCIGIGWACAKSDDCGPGTECDRSLGQCVDREAYACSNTATCRTVEKCLVQDSGGQRCAPTTIAAGQACQRNDANGHVLYGECTKGTYQTNSTGGIECVTNSPKAEVCDSLDNDCDGTVDNHVASHGCTAAAAGSCKQGSSTCVNGSEVCNPGQPQTEVCDGQDNDCNGQTDDISPTGCQNSAAVGDCKNGTTGCTGGSQVCNPGPPSGEVCDGRDNNCDGTVDNLGTVHDAPENDQILHINGGLFGDSENLLQGPADCGGTRKSSAADKHAGGDSWCQSEGWANDLCNSDPNQKIGNSDIKDACKQFSQNGPDRGDHDCRYIVHIGIHATSWIECATSHIVTVPDTCN